MRLIDADALQADMKKRYCADCNSYNGVRCRACWVDDACGEIDDAPTIDPESLLVRCKDCKHTETDGIDAIYCKKWDRWEMPEDFYCAYGAPKEDAE